MLDTSAVLAVFNQEPGADVITPLLPRSAISAVILGEIATKMAEWDVPPAIYGEWLDLFGLQIVSFDRAQASAAGFLRRRTSRLGLSLGDRACLALAASFGVPAYTSDKAWAKFDSGVDVKLFR